MAKITYNDKVALITNPDIADENKVTDNDMNEIKQVVNENDDKFLTNGLNVSTEVDEDYRVNLLKSNNLFDNNQYFIYSNVNTISISKLSTGIKVSNSTTQTGFALFRIKDVSKNVGETFNFKCNFNSNGHYAIGLCDANGGNRIQGQQSTTSGTLLTYTIPTLTTSKYLCIWLYCDITGSIDYTNIMLNEGSEALPYEPYITPSINVDGEEIYSKPVVLWTNPSPTSDFASGNTTLNDNLSNYSYYEILYLFSKTENYELTTGKIETNRLAFLGTLSSSGGNLAGYRRLVSAITNNIITFSGASIITATGTTGSNTICIPYKILGYK